MPGEKGGGTQAGGPWVWISKAVLKFLTIRRRKNPLCFVGIN